MMKIFNRFVCFCICASVMAVPLFISDAQAQNYPKAKKTHNTPKPQVQPAANNPAPPNNNYYQNGSAPANNNRPAPPNNNRGGSPNYNIPNYTNGYDPTIGDPNIGPDAASFKIMSEPNPNGGNPIFKTAKNPYKTESEADSAFNKRYNSELTKWKTIERGYLDNPKYFARFDNNQLLEMYKSLSVLYSDFERDIVRSEEIARDKPPLSNNIQMHAINSFEQLDHLVEFMEKELNNRKLSFKKIKQHVFNH